MKNPILLILSLFFPILLSGQKLKQVIKTSSKGDKIEYTVLEKNKYIRHGEYNVYFKNSKIKESGVYDHNKKIGDWKEYSYDGELRRTRTYKSGRLSSDIKFGIWKEYGQNGKPYFYDYDKGERIMPQIPVLVKYPSIGRETGIEGIVKISVKLDDQCEVKEMSIVQSMGTDFDSEALKGVKGFVEKLKYFEDDCKDYGKIITIEFKLE